MADIVIFKNINLNNIGPNMKQIFKQILNLDKLIFFKIGFIFGIAITLLVVLSLPILIVNKGIGSQNLASTKRYNNENLRICRSDLFFLLGNSHLIGDECSITIYGDKVALTLEENQGNKINSRYIVSNKNDNPIEYEFCYKLYHYLHIIHLNKYIKDLYSFSKNEIINDNGGLHPTLGAILFGFANTKDMNSLSIHVTETYDPIMQLHTKSLLFIMNHNKLTDIKCNDHSLSQLLENRIAEGRDPERIYEVVKNISIFQRILMNIKIIKIKLKYLFYE